MLILNFEVAEMNIHTPYRDGKRVISKYNGKLGILVSSMVSGVANTNSYTFDAV